MVVYSWSSEPWGRKQHRVEAEEDSLNYLVRPSLTIAKLEKGWNCSADKGAGLQA